MAYGTAPRKVNGVWTTAQGRRLNAAGQRYWQQKHDQGFVDDTGHTNPAAVQAVRHPRGLVEKGNIDLTQRATVHAPTPGKPGFHSSVRSLSTDARDGSGNSALIPTVVRKNGKWQVVSDQEAIAHYHKTGQHLGIFKTWQQADRYSNQLHVEQAAAAGRNHATATQATPKPKAPTPTERRVRAPGRQGYRFVRAPLTPQQQRQQQIYEKSKRAAAEAKAYVDTQTRKRFAGVEEAAARANKTVSPAADAVLTALSPLTAAQETIKAARKGKVGAAAVSALGVVPFGPGKVRGAAVGVERAIQGERAAAAAERAAKVEQAGLKGRRALVAGEKVQQVTRARSHVAQVGERVADVTSAKVPHAPIVGERARVAKHAGREVRHEQGRGRAAVESAARALPKKGSDADVAHFWFAHLPPEQRNAEGLSTVKQGLQRELDRTMQRQPLLNPRKASKNFIARQARVSRLQKAYDRALVKAGKRAKPYEGDQVDVEVTRPRTREEAQARLAKLEAAHENMVNDAAKRLKGDTRFDAGETAKRNAERAKYDRQQKGVTRKGKPSGATSRKVLHRPPTLAQELRDQAETHLHDVAQKHKDEPWAQSFLQQEDEIYRLRNAIHESEPGLGEGGAQDFGSIKGTETRSLPTEMPPAGLYNHTVQRVGAALSVAKDELATAAARGARPPKPGKVQVAGLPQEAQNLATQIAHLDRIIAGGHVPDEHAIGTLEHFDRELSATLREAGYLENVDPEARRAIVSNWLGVKPSGQEIYIGHVPNRPRTGLGGIRSMGLGKARAAEPMRRSTHANRLRLVRTGAIRPSTHVAAEDLIAAHTYKDALQARKDLWEMGEPFPGELPKGYALINPDGQVVPAHWKTNRLTNVADNPAELEKASREVLQGFIGNQHNWEQIVQDAKETGVLDKLRIVPERDVKRYYAQFLPPGSRTVGGRVYDKLIDATATSLIFARLGYIPKNFLQNIITGVPHQGVFFPFNVIRAAQLIPKPGSTHLSRELWTRLVHEIGGGVSGSLAQEATSRALAKPANIVTAVADQPLRISAFLHEAAAEGVIPKLSFRLSNDDEEALLHLLTDKAQRAKLNDIKQRGVDAMADFDRLTPTQRRYARRFLIVPGWLMAGTRYPVHFAATHPGRSAALAYLAAGEPGAPKNLQVNKPIDEYLLPGLPSYIQAVSAEHFPGFLGGGPGKNERIQSLLPGSLPFDVGIAASQGAPVPTIASYFNPLPTTGYDVARSVYETPSGETKKTNFMDALVSGMRRLAPSAGVVQGLVSPGSVPSKIYPDHSRLGIIARDLGVVPVKMNREAAQTAQFSERGMTKAVGAAKDEQAFLKKLDDAGYEPEPKLKAAYKVRLERAKRLDKIHAHGLPYQQRAYRSDIAYAVELGKVSKQQAAEMLAGIKGASEEEINSARDDMRDAYFGGDVISQAKRELRNQTAGG